MDRRARSQRRKHPSYCVAARAQHAQFIAADRVDCRLAVLGPADVQRTTGAFVFETERGGPFTADAVNRLVKTIGARAKLSFGVHAHMLRHACGYALANAGHDTRLIQDWLGHRAIQHTARYTELSPTRFKDVWR